MEKSGEEGGKRPPARIPAPVTSQIGLGDVLKRATAAVGVRPCGGCEQRANALNRWIAFTPWNQK